MSGAAPSTPGALAATWSMLDQIRADFAGCADPVYAVPLASVADNITHVEREFARITWNFITTYEGFFDARRPD